MGAVLESVMQTTIVIRIGKERRGYLARFWSTWSFMIVTAVGLMMANYSNFPALFGLILPNSAINIRLLYYYHASPMFHVLWQLLFALLSPSSLTPRNWSFQFDCNNSGNHFALADRTVPIHWLEEWPWPLRARSDFQYSGRYIVMYQVLHYSASCDLDLEKSGSRSHPSL